MAATPDIGDPGDPGDPGTLPLGYDEFALLPDNAAEAGLPFDPAAPPAVRRATVAVPGGTISALVWGDAPPEFVFLHGGAQNAHTWDTVLLALGRPAVALDLPGHGHSSWRADQDYRPATVAAGVAAAITALAPMATTLVGMSLGGLTAIAVLAGAAGATERLLLVDITPGVNAAKTAAITAFVGGPEIFPSFAAILDRTVAHNPTRSRASLERGVRHNARPLPDGTWSWRYDRPERHQTDPSVLAALWDDVEVLPQAVLLARGALSPVVDDGDEAELRRRRAPRPTAVTVIEGAGHSIQGDRPLELAALLERFHEGAT